MSKNTAQEMQGGSGSPQFQSLSARITDRASRTELAQIKKEIEQSSDLSPAEKQALSQAVEAEEKSREAEEKKNKEVLYQHIEGGKEAEKLASSEETEKKYREARIIYEQFYTSKKEFIEQQEVEVKLLERAVEELKSGNLSKDTIRELEQLGEKEEEQKKRWTHIMAAEEAAIEERSHHSQEIDKIEKLLTGGERGSNINVSELKELKNVHQMRLNEANNVIKDVDSAKQEVQKNQEKKKALVGEVARLAELQPAISKDVKDSLKHIQQRFNAAQSESSPDGSAEKPKSEHTKDETEKDKKGTSALPDIEKKVGSKGFGLLSEEDKAALKKNGQILKNNGAAKQEQINITPPALSVNRVTSNRGAGRGDF